MSHQILVVEDDALLARNVAAYLVRQGYEARISPSGEAGLVELERYQPDALVLDLNLPGISGIEVIECVRRKNCFAKIIMTTGHGSEQAAADAMKAGADDYLIKPVVLDQLRRSLMRALGQGPAKHTDARERGDAPGSRGRASLLGTSPPMEKLKSSIRRIVDADANLRDADSPAVLITGETGTGKELVARALHDEGPRARQPFIEVNCSSIPTNLLEAELFGYERGAFTDAKERKIGLIEAAEGGTLFLDEVGEIEAQLQVKLLKLLEDKIVRRLGSVREQRANVRIVAATNRDLEQCVRSGAFRADLYFRLNILRIHTPPLRERGADIVTLAQHFLKRQCERYARPGLHFTDDTLKALLTHSWPGNVRELKNAIEQCVILARSQSICVPDLGLDRDLRPRDDQVSLATKSSALSFCDAKKKFSQWENQQLSNALHEAGWNISKTARRLGLSRDVVRYRIEKAGLKPQL